MKVVDVKKELFDNKILILASDIISLSVIMLVLMTGT